jgi:hypothetical protein
MRAWNRGSFRSGANVGSTRSQEVRHVEERREPLHRELRLAGEDVDPHQLVLQINTGIGVLGDREQ